MGTFLANFFAHPALLGGAATGAVPIIIHLLNRQRFKRFYWAAMHWLWASFKKSQRRLQIEQLLLLLIRVLILVLLAFALARPALQEGLGLLSGQAAVHRVIVLDNSYSMGRVVSGRTLFEKAKEKARDLVDRLSAADELDVVLANDIFEELTLSSTAPKQDVLNQIKAARLSDGGTELPRAIAYACRLLNERKSKNTRKEIIVVTDQTRAAWERDGQPKHIGGDDEAAIEKAFSSKSRPQILVLRLSADKDNDNLAAFKIEVDEKVVPAGAETQFTGTIANYSSAARAARVKFKIDGEEIAADTVPNIAPGKQETIAFRYTFPEPGSHVAALELEDDCLPADNSAFLAVDAEDKIRALCVDGQQRVDPLASELDYFRQALAPTKTDELNAGKMPLFPEVISDALLPEANLENYRLVVLANVALVPPEKIQALERFVKNGGVLWIFTGSRTDPAIYNKDLAALLPMNLGEIVGSGDPNGPCDVLSDSAADHPALAKFKGSKGWSLSHLRTYRRFKLLPKPQEENAARVLLAYENGDPAAVEKSLGDAHGRVVLFSTTANQAWNNWPVTNRYMPLMNYIALDLLQPAYLQRNRTVGERFAMQLPREDLGGARREGIRLVDPLGESSNMEVLTELSRVESGVIRRTGAYAAQMPGEPKRTLHFAANRNSEESDLSPIEDREILSFIPRKDEPAPPGGYFKSLITQTDFILATDDVKEVEAALKLHKGSREIWRWLAGAVLALLVAESILARRFGNFNR